MKRVLELGNCDHDHGLLRAAIAANFAVDLVRCHTQAEALQTLRAKACDLVLVNRQLDFDGTEGLDAIRAIKTDPALAATPVMLVSNLPEAQAEAAATGALPGFGKRELASVATREKLAAILG